MQVKYVNPFLKASLNLFKDHLGLSITGAKPYLNKDPQQLGQVSGIIGLAGETTGAVVLSFSRETAIKVVSAFEGRTYAALGSEVIDGVGEMINIIAGNAKKDLVEFRVEISLPGVITGDTYRIHWPEGISRQGALEHQPGHLVDIMSTCLEVSGATYPPDSAQEVHGLQGQSLTPAFNGREIERDCIFWEHEGNRALRQDHWKLVAKGVEGRWELYDMLSDRSELHNLTPQYPERVKAMAEKWYRMALNTDVIPMDGRVWAERLQHPTG